MGFNIIVGDITKFYGDAIINSVGIDGKVQGRLCKAILKAIDNKEIVKNITDRQFKKTGQWFYSNAGSISCKRIYHLCTPFKKDDPNLEELKKGYSSIIQDAVSKGYTRIGIPIIGTGANGYAEEEVFDLIVEILNEYKSQERKLGQEIIDASIIVKMNSKHSLYSTPYGNREETIPFYYMKVKEQLGLKTIGISDETDLIFYLAKEMATLEYDKCITKNEKAYYYPIEYIENYIISHNISRKVFNYVVYDHKRKYQLKDKKSIDKDIIFKASFVLGMNKTETIELMIINGSSFSPNESKDVFYLLYLNGHFKKVTTIYELENLYKKFKKENGYNDSDTWIKEIKEKKGI